MKQLGAQLSEFTSVDPASVAASTAIKGTGINIAMLEGDLVFLVPSRLTAGTVAAKLQSSVDDVDGDYTDLSTTINPNAAVTISAHAAAVAVLSVNMREAKGFVRPVLTPDGSGAGTVAAVAVAERKQT